MSAFRFILKASRPRFWIYVLGPFLVGLAGGYDIDAGVPLPAFVFAAFFLLPANLLIYGINDIFDLETDKLNEKKAGYEQLVGRDRQRELLVWIALLNIPFFIYAAAATPQLILPIAGFLFFSIFYSAPPIRAKAIPFLDSAFNILYIFPAIIAYRLAAGEYPPAALIAAGACWAAAMHAYSAVPDIDADRNAGLSTTATLLGPARTLLLCGLLYLASAAIAFVYLPLFSVLGGIVYLALIAVSFPAVRQNTVFRIYKLFPAINSACGFVLFWAVVLQKIGH